MISGLDVAMLVKHETLIVTLSSHYDCYYGGRLIEIANYGKIIPVADAIVLSIRGIFGEVKNTQLVRVIVGVKPNPKSPTSELKV